MKALSPLLLDGACTPHVLRVLVDGVQFASATDRATTESKEATPRVEERHDTSRDERRRAQLE